MMDWLRALAPYHDYGWFLALLAWTAAAIVGRRTLRGRPDWAWLPWAAWPGAAAAMIELVSFAWPAPSLAGWAGHLPEDFLLGTLTAVTVAGWIRELPARGSVRVLAVVAVFATAGARMDWPDIGAFAIVGAGTLAALAHILTPGASRSARWALAMAVAALWLSSAGPLASAGWQPRRLTEFGEWSAVWSGAQALAGIIALAAAVAPWFAAGESRREWRPFLIACGAWLLLGLGLAAAMSRSARRNYEMQALARTQVAASLMNKAALVQLLDADFRLTDIKLIPRPGGDSPLWAARVPQLADAAGVRVQHELGLIELADPEKGWAMLQVPRVGWLARINSDRYPGNKRHLVGLSRPTEDDWLDWSERRSRFLPLLLDWTSRANPVVKSRAPLETDDGNMLGWLVLDFPRSQWLAAQVQPRLQAFMIVGLGLCLASVVTLQRVRTREREAARATAMAATQADQLKTSFLAKVSHELRTPIQSVLGYSDLLRNEIKEPVARSRLKALRQHGELMLRLVNDLLDLSAIQAGAFRLVEKPTAFAELVTQTVESLRPRAEGKGLLLSVAVSPRVPTWAQVDGGRVRQVTLNLVGNAIKFTDRGRVDVALESGPGESEAILVVRDTGPGIAAADIGRLFRSFERLDATAAKEGTGLGLALSAALCRGMNGNITVESTAGAGATFRAQFRVQACEPPLVLSSSSAGLPPLSNRNILVADDNALVRELFVATLTEAGARCVAVADGHEALAATECEVFDTVVLDLAMPRLGGLETAQRLRATFGRAMRIVGLSAHAGQQEQDEAAAAGMDTFLVKPVELDALIKALTPAVAAPRATEPGRADLLERLRAQFRGAAAAEGAAVAAAIAEGNYPAARARAHHLMNSAAVVRDDWLYSACARIERAAMAADAAELAAAWQVCEAALEPWIQAPARQKSSSVS